MQELEAQQKAQPAAIAADDNADRGAARYVLSGSWRNASVSPVLADIEKIENSKPSGSLTFDLSGVDDIDTTGAWLGGALALILAGLGTIVVRRRARS